MIKIFVLMLLSYLAGMIVPKIYKYFSFKSQLKDEINKIATKQSDKACKGMHNWFSHYERVCQDCGYSSQIGAYLTDSGLARYVKERDLKKKKESLLREMKENLAEELGMSVERLLEIEKTLIETNQAYLLLAAKEDAY